jgi:hypothetical protein
MAKQFFYLRDSSDFLIGSFGLAYLDEQEAVCQANILARRLQAEPQYSNFFVVATDAKGKELARIVIDKLAAPLLRRGNANGLDGKIGPASADKVLLEVTDGIAHTHSKAS